MKLLLTQIASVIVYFSMAYFGLSSMLIWVALIIIWTAVDYLTYDKPFTWKDYIILAIVLSVVEMGSWYNLYGF